MHWTRRFFIICLILLLEGAAYFTVQHITSHEYDFSIAAIDYVIPIVPEFVWVYHTLVPGILLAHVIFIRRKDIFYPAIISFVIATLVLKMCFLMFPSAYPRGDIEPTSISEQVLLWTYSVDDANNTFPSTHIAFAWLALLNVWRSEASRDRRVIVGYGIWATLISIATLVLKQHNVLDVVSGIGVALLAAWAAKKIYLRIHEKMSAAAVALEQYENC